MGSYMKWNEEMVSEFVALQGGPFKKYKGNFMKAGITGLQLSKVNDATLRRLDIHFIPLRMKLLELYSAVTKGEISVIGAFDWRHSERMPDYWPNVPRSEWSDVPPPPLQTAAPTATTIPASETPAAEAPAAEAPAAEAPVAEI